MKIKTGHGLSGSKTVKLHKMRRNFKKKSTAQNVADGLAKKNYYYRIKKTKEGYALHYGKP